MNPITNTIDEVLKTLLNTDWDLNYHDEHFIDIYELLFEDKNYDQFLSDITRTDIVLDKKEIELYKINTSSLLKTFDIDVYKKYTDEEVRKKIKNAIFEIVDVE